MIRPHSGQGDLMCLRRLLSEFTADGAPRACIVTMWPEQLASISEKVQNTISIVELEPSPNFNCFTFALGLHESKKHYGIHWYTTKVTRNGLFANDEFFRHLLAADVLKRSAHADGLIVYLDDKNHPLHAGRVRADRVRSKWGTGWLVDHGIWEVPVEYGHSFEIYDEPSRDLIEGEFLAWAETHGVDTASVLARTKSI